MTEIRDNLKRIMPNAFPIFFNQRNPYSGQALVMPEIVKGHNVLFAAPTASGKTEAAITPLYQRHISFKRNSLSTVYIAPTKALVNDLYERLMDYLGSSDPDSIARYTGDHHEYTNKDRGFCLIATPEGLDSLQLRKPHLLTTVRAVVVDEIHLLHGQARGQQLRHVIDRIKTGITQSSSNRDKFQIVGMTATLSDMKNVGELWLGKNSKCFSEGNPRDIELKLLDVSLKESKSVVETIAVRFANWVKSSNANKVLIFANSRNNAQSLATHLSNHLKKSRWPIHLHFGPIAKSVRENIEHKMRKDKYGICVATMTLEIGIDIGNIDVIVLADKPFDVSSFLQRIGRGNRRTGTCKVIGFRTDEYDEKYYDALLDCSKRGDLEDVFEYDRPSVRFQQVLSLAWRETRNDRSLTASKLAEFTGTDGHFPIIQDMLETGNLNDTRGALIPCDRLMDECDSARMHTVISGGGGNSVVDMKTGKNAISGIDSDVISATVFHEGQLRELNTAADGSQFLGKNTKDTRQLARFKSSVGPPSKSRSMVWAMARQSGFNPLCWLFNQQLLVTWGGKTLNRLLAEVFRQTVSHGEFKHDDSIISGNFLEFTVTLQIIRNLALQVEKADNIPLETASKFAGSSRYIRELSYDLRAIEYNRSVPWSTLHWWLKNVKDIDHVEEIPSEIQQLIQ